MSITEKILKCLVEYKLLKVLIQKICHWLDSLRKMVDVILAIPARILLCAGTKVVNNKVVFMTYNNDYICNPKYICEEIRRQNLPLDLVWATTKAKAKIPQAYPDDVRLVIRGTYEFFKEIASAKVWVDNAVCFTWNPFPKKKGQFYLQTWHGSMGLKRIGTSDVKDTRWSIAAKLAGKWTDVCISNSQFETDVFRQTHWPKTPILELGHARNDILFWDDHKKAEILDKVRQYFGISEDKKIALYAPTFRNDPSGSCYTLEYDRLLRCLEERFGGEWVLLNRFHFKTKQMNAVLDMEDRIFAATRYPDMQELMVAADAGITDYSSWICDFVLTGKPGFLYTPDLSSYNQERGFYYPLNETPFPIAETNDQMEENIHAFDQEKYDLDCRKFLEARGCREEGRAAERIVQIIREQTGV